MTQHTLSMAAATLTDKEFDGFRRFIYDAAGIHFSTSKKSLVSGRLAKRLQHLNLSSYTEYLAMLIGGQAGAEVQMAIDLLTTNETFFFRENKHFELLRQLAEGARGRRDPMRVWSAACSSGEEPYSMAMVLADVLGKVPWEIVGTDISMRMLQRARTGHYPDERATQIPHAYLKQYCLKGIKQYEGTLLVERSLRQRVSFAQLNLSTTLPDIGLFDCIFLRNVMIYFDVDTKRAVVGRVLGRLRPGGVLCVGHSESLNEINNEVVQLMPSVYRKR
jgi:chemotaxis protein methyltransferase CheR